MTVIQPLDLHSIFVNHLAGSMTIFFFLAVAFFSYLGARFRMPNSAFLIMMGLFLVMMAGYGFEPLLILLIFILGIVFYKGFSKITQ